MPQKVHRIKRFNATRPRTNRVRRRSSQTLRIHLHIPIQKRIAHNHQRKQQQQQQKQHRHRRLANKRHRLRPQLWLQHRRLSVGQPHTESFRLVRIQVAHQLHTHVQLSPSAAGQIPHDQIRAHDVGPRDFTVASDRQRRIPAQSDRKVLQTLFTRQQAAQF